MRRKESSNINSIRTSGRSTKRIARIISAPFTCGRVPADVRRARLNKPPKSCAFCRATQLCVLWVAARRYPQNAELCIYVTHTTNSLLNKGTPPTLSPSAAAAAAGGSGSSAAPCAHAREGGRACQCSQRRTHARRTEIAARASYRRCRVRSCVVHLVCPQRLLSAHSPWPVRVAQTF